MYKLGIDVGGTNTDAVLIDENLKVVARISPSTVAVRFSFWNSTKAWRPLYS